MVIYMSEKLFQTIHSPIGAAAGFALGMDDMGGGFLLEPERIQPEAVLIGYKEKNEFKCFPFFETGRGSGKEAYTPDTKETGVRVVPFEECDITREFGYATDSFQAPKMSFTLMNRICPVPEPGTDDEMMKHALLPGILAEFTVDNREGTESMDAIFGVGGIQGKTFLGKYSKEQYKGAIGTNGCGFAVVNDENLGIQEFGDFDIPSVYRKNTPVPHVLGPIGGIICKVKAGTCMTLQIALGWFKDGIATYNLYQGKYYYTQFYHSLMDVLTYTLAKQEALWDEAKQNDQELKERSLSKEREFLLAQSVKSYYISSMIFCDDKNEVRWVMNEGSFCMMNTFDLLIDHVYFDLKQHPWVIKNQLDVYVKDYSYYDQCGLAFNHDQGVLRMYTDQGYSSYEIPQITDCFSYMSQEELCNWILAASLYYKKENNVVWLKENEKIIVDCFLSMCNRDGEEKDGIMDVDSSRCEGGWEITTYDSLDTSLGQARGNTYIAIKGLACYIACMDMFDTLYGENSEKSIASKEQALLCARTLLSYQNEDGTFPAIYKEDNNTMIIPAIEGMIYPWFIGKWDWMQEQEELKGLIEALKVHLTKVLVKDICIFEDGGWKLSQTSDNSWISKIFLCQFITEFILEVPVDQASADLAHVNWWKVGCSTNPGIDQIFVGTQPERGFHYPRCVTSILWW